MRVVVVGGGIVGLAVAYELSERGHTPVVLEKERTWAAHQTGHNSGVIHSGLYYRPGSLKARLCVAGNKSIVAFAAEHDVPVEICGKLVVATTPGELRQLEVLAERAVANGVKARALTAAEAREYEPEVACVAALHVPSTGATDYVAICNALADRLSAKGAELHAGTAAVGIVGSGTGGGVIVQTTAGDFRGDGLVNCAGLYSDRVARLAGLHPAARIVPFRGEYYELRPGCRSLVKGLIYPVPDPEFPFLGVHLTRMIGGQVHAGPNAVLALRREGYAWRDVSAREVAGVIGFPGFWKLMRRHYRTGSQEALRSLSKTRFAASLARLVPAITSADLVRAPAGVRAQALTRSGALVDDFLIQTTRCQVHVLNAPSPAATSSLEIAKHVVDKLCDVMLYR